MLKYEWFAIILSFSLLAPILGSMLLFVIVIFERNIQLLKSENQKLVLAKELSESEYIRLSQQIQPHFLCNTLNLLANLARLKKERELIKAIEYLALYLRYNYTNSQKMVTVKNEVDHTNNYLQIQKLRFGDRLEYRIEGYQEIKDAFIVPYILQTLVENAFKHGLEKRVDKAVLEIKFLVIDDYLQLYVCDNGPDTLFEDEKSIADGEGTGLKNIISRLKLLFDNETKLNIKRVADKTVVSVYWPLKYAQGIKR